jgi:AraC-like DNA-binding protein
VVDPETGDQCDFFAVNDRVLLEALRAHDQSVEDRPEQPFTSPYAPVAADTFRSERLLIERIISGEADRLEIEESVLWLLDALFHGMKRAGSLAPSARERVEHAKKMLASHLDAPLSIEEIASETGTSLFHLCKIFRRETGMTMSAYRHQLRLRLAFDEVRTSRDFLSTALALGFSSHSYFTSSFRSYFGVTPSELRRSSS